MKAPDNESSWAISLRSAKVSGSEKAWERIGQGPTGQFTPGSELAQERKNWKSARNTATVYRTQPLLAPSLGPRSQYKTVGLRNDVERHILRILHVTL